MMQKLYKYMFVLMLALTELQLPLAAFVQLFHTWKICHKPQNDSHLQDVLFTSDLSSNFLNAPFLWLFLSPRPLHFFCLWYAARLLFGAFIVSAAPSSAHFDYC